jgi:Na+/H+-dicarboxylate symporter
LQKQRQDVLLDAGGIDRLSALLVDALNQAEVERRDVVRLRLAMEDILTLWLSGLESGTKCTFRCGTRLGRMYIKVQAPGRRIDPGETDGEVSSGLLYSSLLAQAGISPVYSYQDGVNQLAIYPPKPRKISPVVQLLLSIVAAVVCGLLCRALPSAAQEAASGIVTPLFNALLGILQTLAGPLIFLSVCVGIIGIGDIQALGRIGKTVVSRFMVAIFLITGGSALCLTWMFHPGNGTAAEGSNAASQIYGMLLDIIPTNVVKPFYEGNSLQIIFMAICVGIMMLILGDKVSALRTVIEQLNLVVQSLMETVSRYIPVFVFVSLLSLFLSDAMDGLGGTAKAVVVTIVCCVLCALAYALVAAISLKVPYRLMLRKLLPTYLIALTTASSAAALSTNLETCRRRLGIPEEIVSFAVPLGQVLFMPGAAIGFFVVALGLAESCGVSMPLPWVVTAALVSALLSIAAPPIPGGSLSCCAVLLAQLGIPESAIGLAIAAKLLLDFFETGCGISCLQSELAISAGKLGMLNRDILENAE